MKNLWLPVAIALSLPTASPAWSSDRWEEAGSGAVAILPMPEKATGISGASLFCVEQRWSFLFRLEAAAVEPGTRIPGTVTVGGETFPVETVERNGLLVASVPSERLEQIKASTRMGIKISKDATSLSAEFLLRDSRRVIDAVAPRCSQVDMSAYEQVVLSETDPAVGEAERLLADEVTQFTAATGHQPIASARLLELTDGKALLLASLCGSSRYYGASGCSLSGFVRQGSGAQWQLAYDTEGMLLYLDRKATKDGFPAIVTLPVSGGTVRSHWIWTGTTYEIHDEVLADGAGAERSPAR